MRISLPPIPSRWEIIEELFEEKELFNTNCSTMHDDCMQLFHGTSCPCISRSRISDDESGLSDEDIYEEDHDQAKLMTPVKATGDVTIRFWCFLLTEIDLL
jgi:hypothetical protein